MKPIGDLKDKQITTMLEGRYSKTYLSRRNPRNIYYPHLSADRSEWIGTYPESVSAFPSQL